MSYLLDTPAIAQDLEFYDFPLVWWDKTQKEISLDISEVQKDYSFRTKDGQYNLLAQLLSKNSHFSIQMHGYAGKTRKDILYYDKEVGFSCIFLSLTKILEFGEIICLPIADERNRRAVRKEIDLFSPTAFKEAVYNAIQHTRWDSQKPPQIVFFKDYVEVISYGEYDSQWLSRVREDDYSEPVSPELYSILKKADPDFETGKGMGKIIQEIGEENLLIEDDQLTVLVPFLGYEKSSTNKVRWTVTRRAIVREMRRDPTITGARLAVRLGMSHTAIDNNIAHLKKAGVIKRIGGRKSGIWEVQDWEVQDID